MRGLKFLLSGLTVCAAAAAACLFPLSARAADHGDAPNVAGDQNADLGDTYVFLDPNDNTKVILAMTFRGFIVPGEAVNFTTFDPNTLYRFEIENTGDAKPDASIDVTFSPKGTAASEPQTATVRLPGRPKTTITAPTTVATFDAVAPAPTVTTDAATGVSVFAGEVDDPFFFDIPAFGRFIASVRAGSPNPALLSRGRDTFAGYNILCIALSVPRDLVRGAADNNVIGVNAVTLRRQVYTINRAGVARARGLLQQIDRSGNPAVNVALVPYARKNEFNRATPRDDAAGKFAADIVATLTALGTNQANIDTLAGVAVTNGDYEHINLTTANTGTGGGNNPPAAFPNGRRPQDDVIDTYLTIINNGTDLGDSVNANDVPFRNTFPFFAPPNQPLANGNDNTKN
jgi:hypothetical protein